MLSACNREHNQCFSFQIPCEVDEKTDMGSSTCRLYTESTYHTRWASCERQVCFSVPYLSDSFEGGGPHRNSLFSSLFKHHNVESKHFSSHLQQGPNMMCALKSSVFSS